MVVTIHVVASMWRIAWFFRVHDEDVAVFVDSHFLWRGEDGLAGVASVTGVAARSGAGDRFDNAIADAPDAASLALHDVEGSVGREGDGAGAEDRGLRCRTAVSVVAGFPGAGEGADRAGAQVGDMHAMAGDVGDEKLGFVGAEGKPVGFDEFRQRGDDAAVDDPHAAVQAVGEEYMPQAVDHDPVRLVQRCLRGGGAVAGKALDAGAADR